MARGPIVPAEKRQEMIDYAMANDVDAAVEKYGVKKRTLRSWLSRAGLASDVSEKRQKAIDASKQTFELRHANLKESILTEAEFALADMRKEYTHLIKTKDGDEFAMQVAPEPGDRAKLATAFGILFDKLQLATGGPTVNSVTHTPDLKGLVEAQNRLNAVTKIKVAEALAGEG